MAGSRREPRPTLPPSPAATYGIHRVGAWTYWAAWIPRALAPARRFPDASGFARMGSALLGAALEIFGAVAKVDMNQGADEARTWLRANGVPDHAVQRDDAAAYGAWLRAGSPLPPGTPPAPSVAAEAPRWVAELGCPWPPTRAQVVDAARKRMAAQHPDAPGGSKPGFERAQRARDMALGWLAARDEGES